MFNNILLLTDFSDLSRYAQSLADKVASACGAELHMVHVVQVPSEIEIGTDGALIGGMSDDLTVLKDAKAEAMQKMELFSEAVASKNHSVVVYGRIQEMAERYIRFHSIDLVVMGTHGLFGLKSLLSSSVTEHLILNNNIPVLSLKCDREEIEFSNLLITGDFNTAHSMQLTLFKVLEQAFDATLHLLWVNRPGEFLTTVEAENKMQSFAEKNGLKNTRMHVYNDSSLEEGIVHFCANQEQENALTMAIVAVEKKDKSALSKLLTGCSATTLVNHIFMPIITYLKE